MYSYEWLSLLVFLQQPSGKLAMASFKVVLPIFLLLQASLFSYALGSNSLHQGVMEVERAEEKELKLLDYDEPEPNPGHDPSYPSPISSTIDAAPNP